MRKFSKRRKDYREIRKRQSLKIKVGGHEYTFRRMILGE
jgi:hypothetical protein